MDNSKVTFKRIYKCKMSSNKISKKRIIEVFKNIAARFEEMDDNEISKKILELLPEARSILINDDINKDKDVPFIVVQMANREKKIIEIKRRHKIVWSILESYC